MGMTFTDNTQSQVRSGRFAVVLLVFCETCTKESIGGEGELGGGRVESPLAAYKFLRISCFSF